MYPPPSSLTIPRALEEAKAILDKELKHRQVKDRTTSEGKRVSASESDPARFEIRKVHRVEEIEEDIYTYQEEGLAEEVEVVEIDVHF